MKLFDYQTDGVNWMICRENIEECKYPEDIEEYKSIKGGILADEVGLGKTLQSIELITKNIKPNTLIIVPKSLLNQWKSEFEKFAHHVHVTFDEELYHNTDQNIIHVHIASHSKMNAKNTDIENNVFTRIQWDRVIVDEAHVLKNHRSKIHKACANLQTDIKWALSATPVMNKMEDFINIIKWVGIPQNICQNYTKDIVKYFTKRRTKEDVCSENIKLELPKCHIENVKLNFETSYELDMYIDVYNGMRDKMLEIAQTQSTQNIVKALELLLRVRQICCHPNIFIECMEKKYKTLSSFAEKNIQSTKLLTILKDIKSTPKEDKCLIFCHFIREMDFYCDSLKSEGFDIARLDGSMDNIKRSFNVNKFNTDQSCKVMVIQVNSGGVGFNFQVANRLYITSPTWNPSLQHQVIGRAHRTGQKKEVYVKIYSIKSENENETFIEDYIINLQKVKLKMISEVLGDSRLFPNINATKIISFSDVSKMFKNKL
jgi:SNF2 family DNA or RNA helicase